MFSIRHVVSGVKGFDQCHEALLFDSIYRGHVLTYEFRDGVCDFAVSAGLLVIGDALVTDLFRLVWCFFSSFVVLR